ncbi:MAG: dTMP kinase [Clostridia bacterium]|nr:dTMP kinase [Clostridia bacterium]
MNWEKIVFDMDGTLLDTGSGVFGCLEMALNEHGIEYTKEQIADFVGPPMHTQLCRTFGMDPEYAAQVTQTYRNFYRIHGVNMFDNYEGIPQLLKRLKLSGRRLFVATNKPHEFAVTMLKNAGVYDLFERVEGADMVSRTDKKAEIILKALDNDISGAVMVGDRINDVEGAGKAGIPCIYVGYGFGSREEAIECGADYYAQGAKELSDILGASGAFISFEGGDGAGKTTQMDLLEKYLREEKGLDVVRTREPGGTKISEKIRALLLDKDNAEMTPVTEALLYAAARAQHVSQVIKPALESGKVVLCDRFYDSSFAYQAIARGLGADMIESVNAPAIDGVMPMRTYILKARRTIERIKEEKDRIERENTDFHDNVAKGFDIVAENAKNRVVSIDATCSIGEVFDIIKKDMDTLF